MEQGRGRALERAATRNAGIHCRARGTAGRSRKFQVSRGRHRQEGGGQGKGRLGWSTRPHYVGHQSGKARYPRLWLRDAALQPGSI